jgi:hypothetical protein
MATIPSMLCIFDHEGARQQSCFSEDDASWIDHTDHGRCRYVSANLEADDPDSGFMSALAAIVVIRPDCLQGPSAERLTTWLSALDDHSVPVELVTTALPVAVYAWLNLNYPRMLRCFRQDGEVQTDLPSWWRQRAEHHLANPGSHGTAGDDSSTAQFSVETLKKYLANRHLRT